MDICSDSYKSNESYRSYESWLYSPFNPYFASKAGKSLREIFKMISRSNTNFPNKIIKSGNRTIVFWSDGTKTIVKRADDEPDSDYAAFTAALAIKIFGSNSAVKRIVRNRTKVQTKKLKSD